MSRTGFGYLKLHHAYVLQVLLNLLERVGQSNRRKQVLPPTGAHFEKGLPPSSETQSDSDRQEDKITERFVNDSRFQVDISKKAQTRTITSYRRGRGI